MKSFFCLTAALFILPFELKTQGPLILIPHHQYSPSMWPWETLSYLLACQIKQKQDGFKWKCIFSLEVKAGCLKQRVHIPAHLCKHQCIIPSWGHDTIELGREACKNQPQFYSWDGGVIFLIITFSIKFYLSVIPEFHLENRDWKPCLSLPVQSTFVAACCYLISTTASHLVFNQIPAICSHFLLHNSLMGPTAHTLQKKIPTSAYTLEKAMAPPPTLVW